MAEDEVDRDKGLWESYRVEEGSVTDVNIDSLGGNCPVQAEGTICGEPFYFRARGSHWSVAIGGDVINKPSWLYEEEYPGAGWMSEAQAVAFIYDAAQRYSFEK